MKIPHSTVNKNEQKNAMFIVCVSLLKNKIKIYHVLRRHSGLMVCALVPRSSGPGSSPGWGQCCVLGQDI